MDDAFVFPQPDVPQIEIRIGYARADGSLVGLLNGVPYHFVPGQLHWDDALAVKGDCPVQQPVERDGVVIASLPEYYNGVLVSEIAGLPWHEPQN